MTRNINPCARETHRGKSPAYEHQSRRRPDSHPRPLDRGRARCGARGPHLKCSTRRWERSRHGSRLPEVPTSMPRSRRPRPPFPAGRRRRRLRRARILSRFKELIEAHADELARLSSREHGKVLSDAGGEVTRGLEVVEFACGVPASAEGRIHRAGRPRRRQLFAAPAARRRRRHHAVQFPGHGADVDVPGRASPAATASS